MGFLGLGKKKRAAPGSETDRRVKLKNDKEQLVLDALKDLKDSGDPRFFDLVARQAGLPAQSHNDFDDFLARLGKFRDLGLLDNAKGDGIGRQIGEAAKAIEPMVQRLMGGMPSAPAQIQVPVGYKLVPIEASSPPVAQIEAAAPTDTAPVPTEQVSLSPISAQVINILSGMTPQQGAEWLTQQKAKFADWLVSAICMTPDDKLPELLLQVSGEVPDFAGVIAWMRARPDWLSAFVQTVRTLKQKWPQQIASTA